MEAKNDASLGQSSVEVGHEISIMTSMPVRLFRAAVAGLAITGIGYYALASSPELNKSFSQLTGLSVIDPVAASTGCTSTCGAYPENECSGKGCGMVPYTDNAMSVSLDATEGTCCSSSMMAGTTSETSFQEMSSGCCIEGAEECAGGCPFTKPSGEAVASETTTTDLAEANSVEPGDK